MSNKVINVIAFSVGAAIGSVVTWMLAKKKYEKIARDEINEARNEIREVYSKKAKKAEEADEVKECANIEKEEKSEDKPFKFLNSLGYASDSKLMKEEKGGSKDSDMERIYVIPPDAFGEHDDYKTESLTYYADGVLARENGDIIKNPDGLVGVGSLDTFGEYEDDSVFVRNELLDTDFEILLDVRSYSDVNDQ